MNAKSLRIWEDAPVEVTIVAPLTSLDCVSNPSRCISMAGAKSLDHGTKGRFIFPSSRNPLSEPLATDVDLKLAQAGATIRFLKQPVLGDTGGNPWISAQFFQGGGASPASEALPGCRLQLAPGN